MRFKERSKLQKGINEFLALSSFRWIQFNCLHVIHHSSLPFRSRYQLFVFRETVVHGSFGASVIDRALQHEGSFVKRRKQGETLVLELQQLAVSPCTFLYHDFY